MPKKQTGDIGKRALVAHKKLGGKVEVAPKAKLRTREDLSVYYSPGVGAVSSFLAEHPERAREYTVRRNTVAVVSDGSAVLGLGNIGPIAALPVMEGKAMLFKHFAGVDAFPMVLETQDTEEIVETVVRIAPNFGGINLEDIAAPRCFEIEAKLRERLDIPVFHDDQHGTAMVVLAGILNALRVVKKQLDSARIVIAGAGAAGNAIAKLLLMGGAKDIVVADSKGVLSSHRNDLDASKQELLAQTNPRNVSGVLADALVGADVFIGVSKGNTVNGEMVASMAEQSIVFALANPVPEIMPDEAKRSGAKVVATGRSDFPNQINNVLGFPGIFRGALDHRVTNITDDMLVRAAGKLAKLVSKPKPDMIIPSPFDKRVARVVAGEIR